MQCNIKICSIRTCSIKTCSIKTYNTQICNNAAKKIALTHYQFCRNIIFEEIPNFLKDDQYQIEHACANIYEMRGAVLEEALKTGYITYSDNDSRYMLGAYLIID
jgi:hypothetical protein